MENNTLVFIGVGPVEVLLLLFIVVIPAIIWIWALVDVLTSKFANSIEKLIWLVAIVFVPVLGAVLYLIIGRKQKIRVASGI